MRFVWMQALWFVQIEDVSECMMHAAGPPGVQSSQFQFIDAGRGPWPFP